MWLMKAIRQRSCAKMMQAFTFGTRCGIPMDALLDAQGTPAAAAGSMASLAPLLFTPGHAQPIAVDTRLDASEVPLDALMAIGRTQVTINEGWVLVREHNHGVGRFFASPAFERDIATWEALVKGYNSEDPNHPELELVFPRTECSKVLHAYGVQVGHSSFGCTCSQCCTCSPLPTPHFRPPLYTQ
jgi:hypothetical protein